jgi:hypothetical protein
LIVGGGRWDGSGFGLGLGKRCFAAAEG